MSSGAVTNVLFLLLLMVAPTSSALAGTARRRGDRSAFVIGEVVAVGALAAAALIHFMPST